SDWWTTCCGAPSRAERCRSAPMPWCGPGGWNRARPAARGDGGPRGGELSRTLRGAEGVRRPGRKTARAAGAVPAPATRIRTGGRIERRRWYAAPTGGRGVRTFGRGPIARGDDEASKRIIHSERALGDPYRKSSHRESPSLLRVSGD